MNKFEPVENANSKALLNDTISSAVSSNSLIMLEIFKKLDFETLKSSRLVCHEWKNQATKLIANKSKMNLKSVFSQAVTSPIQSINIDLVQNVSCDISELNRGRQHVRKLLKQFGMFCKAYKKQIRGMTIEKYFNSFEGDFLFMSSVYKLLKICKNVEKFELVHYNSYGHDEEGLDIDNNSREFSVPLKLNSVVLDLRDFERLIPLFNNLLAASPALTDLNITGNYYPDLSHNFCLRKLIVRSDCSEHWGSFDIQKLGQMIEKVSGSLEYLELDGSDYAVHDSIIVPQMPKLKTFVNDALYPMSLKIIHQSPNLTTLKLGRNSGNIVLEWDRTCNIQTQFEASREWMKSHPHSKLTSLELGPLRNTSVSTYIAEFFPNLLSLKLTLGKQYENTLLTTQQIHDKVQALFEACSRLKLKDLSVTLNWKYDLGALAHIFLKSSKLFKGLKTLVVRCEQPFGKCTLDLKRPIGINELETAFLPTKKLDRCELVGFHIDPSVLKSLSEFIEKMNLPITVPRY